MSSVLVDSNVILDIVTEDPRWSEWSSSSLAHYAETGMLVINPIIYAEVSVGFQRIEDLDDILPADSFRRDPLPWEAASGWAPGPASPPPRGRRSGRSAHSGRSGRQDDAPDALSAGATGALPVDGERLAAAVRAVPQGLLALDESFAPILLRDASTPPGEVTEPLTPREREILQLLSQGLPNKRIAQRLGISDHTVNFHVNALLGKLGVQSRSEAIVHAVRLGLVVL